MKLKRKIVYAIEIAHTKIKSRQFNHIGYRSIIHKPLQLDNTKTIYIGDRTYIAQGAWLMGNNNTNKVTLSIGNDVQIGHYSHIIGTKSVKIADSVLIADSVFITDSTHCYEDIHIPILDQGIQQIGEVEIGYGSWIGEGVRVLGRKIGEHCVIGANSVVTKDVPDYCMVAGSPARVIKKWDKEKNKWVRSSNTGE